MRNQSLCLALLAVSLVAGRLEAEDFCIQNRVSFGKDVVESETIFHGSAAYDFLSDPLEITISDPPRKRFIVLDPTRRVKTELSQDDVDAFNEKIKLEAQRRNIPLLSFLSDPAFEQKADEARSEITFNSQWLSYRVEMLEPKFDSAVAAYADYSNWQAKLNAVLRPGSLPPFPRLLVNAAIEKQGRVPETVELTRYAQHPAKRQITIEAQHRWRWKLYESDLKRIEQADQYLVTFKLLSTAEYIRRDVAPAGK